jgi:transcription initiation factor TFIIB
VCGVVTNDPIIAMSYSRNYRDGLSNSGQREYPTSNMMYDLDLPTIIDSKNFDAKGVGIRRSYELTQLRKWNTYTISGDSRRVNQAKALREIEQIVRTLGMSNSVARQACEVYRSGLKRGIIGGKSITSMAAASVLVASDMIGTSCSADDIGSVRGTADKKTVRRYHKLLLKSMNLRVNAVDPSRYISKIAGRAKLNGRTERRALEILAQVKDNAVLAGKRPVSLAAGALYLASTQTHDQTNQSRLAYAAGVTPMTIRERSSEISGLLT